MTAAYIDSHCHLDFSVFADDFDAHLARWQSVGVRHYVVPAIGRQNWQQVLQLAKGYSCIDVALGIHPYCAQDHDLDALSELEEIVSRCCGTLCALGEIGLDRSRSNFSHQQALFEGQLKIAKRFALPVIIHSHKTHSEVLGALRRERIHRGVIHAFSGSLEDALKFVAMGFCLGVGAVLAWPRASKTRKALAQVPLEYLVFETDAPDMPIPGQAKGEASPGNIPIIARALSELREESELQIEQQLWLNSCRLFGLELPVFSVS